MAGAPGFPGRRTRWTGPTRPRERPSPSSRPRPPTIRSDARSTSSVELVAAGGVVAAGANVDLGAGFRSARLAGARGDQRDAVLAALRVLGVEDAHRLGDRAGFLVALFGPAVTRRVGAAAARAIGEGRWAALHLAVAASDTLGPEQVEQVLALRAPEGVDLTPDGPPSALAHHLRQVLEPVPRPRKLELVLDLWAQVLEHHSRPRAARAAARDAEPPRPDRRPAPAPPARR